MFFLFPPPFTPKMGGGEGRRENKKYRGGIKGKKGARQVFLADSDFNLYASLRSS